MANAKVKIPPVLRAQTGGESLLDASGGTVGEVLDAVAEQFPPLAGQLFDDAGELNRYVNIYLNDEDVRVLGGTGTAIGEGDTIVILPAMAGGAPRS
jgi:molybdopterin synthase sulfur carrier subunit